MRSCPSMAITTTPRSLFKRYADDFICHCRSETQARQLRYELEPRFAACKLQLRSEKTQHRVLKGRQYAQGLPISSVSALSTLHRSHRYLSCGVLQEPACKNVLHETGAQKKGGPRASLENRDNCATGEFHKSRVSLSPYIVHSFSVRDNGSLRTSYICSRSRCLDN